MLRDSVRLPRHRGLIVVALLALCLAVVVPAAAGTVWTARAASTTKAVAGWPGGLAAYQGRYHLTASSSVSFATSGTLTIFGRVVPRQPHPVMSGILSLYATSGTTVLYLTQFVHMGTVLSAQVNAGLFTGPRIGAFRVRQHAAGDLVAGFVQARGGMVTLHFARFSTNPHP